MAVDSIGGFCNKQNLARVAAISLCVVAGATAPLVAMKVASLWGMAQVTGAGFFAWIATVPLSAEALRNVKISHGNYVISCMAGFLGYTIAMGMTVGLGATVGGSLLASAAIGLSVGVAVVTLNFWGMRTIQQYA